MGIFFSISLLIPLIFMPIESIDLLIFLTHIPYRYVLFSVKKKNGGELLILMG